MSNVFSNDSCRVQLNVYGSTASRPEREENLSSSITRGNGNLQTITGPSTVIWPPSDSVAFNLGRENWHVVRQMGARAPGVAAHLPAALAVTVGLGHLLTHDHLEYRKWHGIGWVCQPTARIKMLQQVLIRINYVYVSYLRTLMICISCKLYWTKIN